MPNYDPKDKKLFKSGIGLLREYEGAYNANKETLSALGKVKTKVKNFFKEFIAKEGVAATSIVFVDGVEYTFAAASSDILDPRKWHELWKNGEITEDQYFDAIKVGKEEAKNAIGEDQCLAIQVTVMGTTADIRRKETTHEGAGVLVPEAKKGIAPRNLQPALQALAKPEPAGRKLIIRKLHK